LYSEALIDGIENFVMERIMAYLFCWWLVSVKDGRESSDFLFHCIPNMNMQHLRVSLGWRFRLRSSGLQHCVVLE